MGANGRGKDGGRGWVFLPESSSRRKRRREEEGARERNAQLSFRFLSGAISPLPVKLFSRTVFYYISELYFQFSRLRVCFSDSRLSGACSRCVPPPPRSSTSPPQQIAFPPGTNPSIWIDQYPAINGGLSRSLCHNASVHFVG